MVFFFPLAPKWKDRMKALTLYVVHGRTRLMRLFSPSGVSLRLSELRSSYFTLFTSLSNLSYWFSPGTFYTWSEKTKQKGTKFSPCQITLNLLDANKFFFRLLLLLLLIHYTIEHILNYQMSSWVGSRTRLCCVWGNTWAIFSSFGVTNWLKYKTDSPWNTVCPWC